MASNKISVEVSFTRESLRALERVAEKTSQAHDCLREVAPAPEYEPVEERADGYVYVLYIDGSGKSHLVARGGIRDVEEAGWRKVWVRNRWAHGQGAAGQR